MELDDIHRALVSDRGITIRNLTKRAERVKLAGKNRKGRPPAPGWRDLGQLQCVCTAKPPFATLAVSCPTAVQCTATRWTVRIQQASRAYSQSTKEAGSRPPCGRSIWTSSSLDPPVIRRAQIGFLDWKPEVQVFCTRLPITLCTERPSLSRRRLKSVKNATRIDKRLRKSIR